MKTAILMALSAAAAVWCQAGTAVAEDRVVIGQPSIFWHNGQWQTYKAGLWTPYGQTPAVSVQAIVAVGTTPHGDPSDGRVSARPWRHRRRVLAALAGAGEGGQPTSLSNEPIGSIGQTTIGIGQPTIGIGQPTIGIGQPTIGIGQPTIGIGQPTIGIGQPTIGIGQPDTGLGRPNAGFGRANGLGPAAAGLGQLTIGIGRPAAEVGTPAPRQPPDRGAHHPGPR